MSTLVADPSLLDESAASGLSMTCSLVVAHALANRAIDCPICGAEMTPHAAALGGIGGDPAGARPRSRWAATARAAAPSWRSSPRHPCPAGPRHCPAPLSSAAQAEQLRR